MWLRYFFLLGCLLLVFSDDAAISKEDTLDDVELGADDVDTWINAPDTRHQESAESEDDDRGLNTGDDNEDDLNTGDDNDRDLNTEDDNDRGLNTGDDNEDDLNTEDDNDRDLNTEDDNDRGLNTGDDNEDDLNTGDDNEDDLNTGDDNDRDLNTGDDNDRDLNTGDDNDRDLNTEDDNDRDLNIEDDNDRDLNTEDDNDRDLNTDDHTNRDLKPEGDNDRDLNTDGDNDRDLNTEGDNDRDLNKEGDNDRDLNKEGDNDRDLDKEGDNDRDLDKEGDNDRDLNKEGDNDRDLNADNNNNHDLNTENDSDEHSDKHVNEKDGDDRDSEQILTTTIVPVTKRTANRRTDVSSNNRGHVTKKKANKFTRVTESQRGKSINNKANKTGLKNDKIVASNHTGVDPNPKSTREGPLRKKRLPPSSASPSIQLIILVVGAVLACVLITGFIRWRIRKRLNDKKLGKMADNLAVYRSRMALPKTSIMDTIYECECEDRVSALHAQSTDLAHATDGSLGSTKSITDELYCSHKFDNPHSIVSSRHYDGDSYRSYSKSSKGDREYDRVHGSHSKSTGHKRHHSHRGRYSRHHRRKHHDKTNSHKAENISPTNEASEEENLDNISCSTSLLEQPQTTEVERIVSSHDPVDVTVTPVELIETSPQQSRGILGSVLNTWQSLSFNREWVGRMWQEKHNVRRISDVLHNVRATCPTDNDESPPERQTSDGVVHNQSDAASLEHGTLATIIDVESSSNSENICLSNVDPSMDSTVVTLFHSEEAPENPPEQNGCHEQSVSEIATSGTACVPTETSLDAERGQASSVGPLPEFLSFSDYNEEPPEYESLLDSESFSNHSIPRSNIEHPRHHRRHRRKRTEGRERSNRHVYSRVQEVDASHADNRDSPTPHGHEEQTALKCDYKTHEILGNLEPPSDDASTVTTPLCLPGFSEDTNVGHHVFTHSPSGHTVSPVAAPFVPQEGIVLEQLSDGAQIIYLPPPVLPSYHNDTPPPYHK